MVVVLLKNVEFKKIVNFKFKYIRSSIEESGNLIGHFVLYNLLPGQGLTIGNALRRVLLSNIEGASITGIKIPNIVHEFSQIPGIREDILEIMLNLKQIVIKTSEKKQIFGKINIIGPGIITGKSIKFDSKASVINPNQYIGTIASKTNIKFSILVENGSGYEMADQISSNNLNFLKLDAFFMPVIKVNYKINNIYISKTKIVESLDLEITTNGSLSPQEALNQAAEKLALWFNNLIYSENFNKIDQIVTDNNKISLEFEKILIEDLELPIRAYNCLKYRGIDSIAQLLKYSQDEIKQIKNFGKKSANQLFETLKTKFNIILS
jgi:DNA-directed RNA polymerase subunit alpha